MTSTTPEELKMEDLERLSGQPRRNIRFLISEGIVPEPRSRGRFASYGPEHVAALTHYAQLKASGVESLKAIRERIASARQGGTLHITPFPGVDVRIEASVLNEMGADALAEAIGEAVRKAASRGGEESEK